MSDNIEKFEGIPEIISEMTRTQMTSQYSVGPLPQEVLSDLTDEDKEKLINNFINQETKDHEKEILLINTSAEITRDREKKIFQLSILGIAAFLLLVGMCLFSGNKEVLYDILKIFVGVIGGLGLGIGIRNRKQE